MAPGHLRLPAAEGRPGTGALAPAREPQQGFRKEGGNLHPGRNTRARLRRLDELRPPCRKKQLNRRSEAARKVGLGYDV